LRAHPLRHRRTLGVGAESHRAAVRPDDRGRRDLRRRCAEGDARDVLRASRVDRREGEVEVARCDDRDRSLRDELVCIRRRRRLVGLGVDPFDLDLLAEDAACLVDLVDPHLEQLTRLEVVRREDAGLRRRDADQNRVCAAATECRAEGQACAQRQEPDCGSGDRESLPHHLSLRGRSPPRPFVSVERCYEKRSLVYNLWRCYWAAHPPSTRMLSPWMYRAASEARKTATGAMSSTTPTRPNGVRSIIERL